MVGIVKCGGGKSYAMLLDPLHDIHNPNFTAQIFRKNIEDVMLNGGLFETARTIYPALGAVERTSARQFLFPSGATVNFGHLQNEAKSVIDNRFRGLQIPAIYLDEGTQLQFSTVMKLITSNRNGHGIRNRVHISCNPDRDSYLRELIDWFIDDDGYVIKERDGVIRYFFLNGDSMKDLVWGNSREEVYQLAKEQIDSIWDDDFETLYGMTRLDLIKDMTFIEGSLKSNRKLIESDPNYLASISMGTDEDRSRNILGCWNIAPNDTDQMVSTEDLDAMFDNAEQRTGRFRMSVDVALKGQDRTVICVWDGMHVVDIEVRGYLKSGEELRSLMKRYMDQYNIREEDVYYDSIGVGSMLSDFTKAYAFNANSKTFNEDESFQKVKDQVLWTFGNMLQNNKLSIDESLSWKRFDYGTKGKLSVRDIMHKEIKALRVNDNGDKTKMDNKADMKKTLGHSPDFLEAMAYGIIHTLQKNKGKSKKKGLNYLR